MKKLDELIEKKAKDILRVRRILFILNFISKSNNTLTQELKDFEIPKSTYYRWKKKFDLEGEKGIERNWIGSIDEKNSVAYNLKHIFSFNINKDSGFNKNWWDKFVDNISEIPGSLVYDILKIIVTAILVYLLVKLGLVEKGDAP